MPVDQRCDEQRIDIARPVELLDPDVGLGVLGYTKNLSISGMRARLDVAPSPGNNLQLAINLADGTSPLETLGEVIWCTPDSEGEGAEIGLRFLSHGPDTPEDIRTVAEQFPPEIQTVRLGQRLMLDTVEQIVEVCVEEILQDDTHSPETIHLNLSVQNRKEKTQDQNSPASDDELLASANMWKPHPMRDLRNWLHKYLGPVFIVAMALGIPCARAVGSTLQKMWLKLPEKTRQPAQNLFSRLNLEGNVKRALGGLKHFRESVGAKIDASRDRRSSNEHIS